MYIANVNMCLVVVSFLDFLSAKKKTEKKENCIEPLREKTCKVLVDLKIKMLTIY